MTREELDAIVSRLKAAASTRFPQALEMDLERLVREAEKVEALKQPVEDYEGALLNDITLLFFDAMSVKCEPSSYAKRCIALVRAAYRG
jgi:hypothetical protein